MQTRLSFYQAITRFLAAGFAWLTTKFTLGEAEGLQKFTMRRADGLVRAAGSATHNHSPLDQVKILLLATRHEILAMISHIIISQARDAKMAIDLVVYGMYTLIVMDPRNRRNGMTKKKQINVKCAVRSPVSAPANARVSVPAAGVF